MHDPGNVILYFLLKYPILWPVYLLVLWFWIIRPFFVNRKVDKIKNMKLKDLGEPETKVINNTTSLQDHLKCPNCGEELELEEKEKIEGKFTCPECNKFIDLNKENKNDEEKQTYFLKSEKKLEEQETEVKGNTILLPEIINCTKCGEEIELNEKERIEHKYTCPECNTFIEMNSKDKIDFQKQAHFKEENKLPEGQQYKYNFDVLTKLYRKTYKAWIDGSVSSFSENFKYSAMSLPENEFRDFFKSHEGLIYIVFKDNPPEEDEVLLRATSGGEKLSYVITNKYFYFFGTDKSITAIKYEDGKVLINNIASLELNKGVLSHKLLLKLKNGKEIFLKRLPNDAPANLIRNYIDGQKEKKEDIKTNEIKDDKGILPIKINKVIKFEGICFWTGKAIKGYAMPYEVRNILKLYDKNIIIGYACPNCGVVSDSRIKESGIVINWWSGYDKCQCKNCGEKIPQPIVIVTQESYEEKYSSY